MFPHKVTVFNVIRTKDSVTYHRQVVSDVFYCKDDSNVQEGHGEKTSSTYDIIFSSKALEKWVSKQEFIGAKDTYTLRKNDVIVLNEYDVLNDLFELQKSNTEWFLIKNISENLYGDKELWNIEVMN